MIWLKRVIRGTLVALIVILIGAGATWFWLLHTEAGAAWAWHQVESAMGGELSGEMSGGDFASGVEIKDLHLSLGADELFLESFRASIDVDLIPLGIKAEDVQLRGLAISTGTAESDGELDLESILSGLSLPLQLDIADLQVDDIVVSTSAGEPLSIDRVGGSVFWHDNIRIRQFYAVSGDDSLTAEGSVELVPEQSIDLAINAIYQAITIQSDFSSDGRSAALRNLRLTGDAIEAQASADVNWIGGLRASGNIAVERFDPATLTAEWPASKSVRGSLSFDASPEYVRLSDTRLAISNSDISLQLDGNFDRASEKVSADLSWQNLQWPLDSSEPLARSADGSITIDGDLDDWRVNGSIALATKEMPDGRFEINGGGDRGQLALAITEGQVFGAKLAGEGTYSWRDDQAWSLDVEFENLNTAAFAPEWPGEVSGKATASGTLSPLAIDMTLQGINGRIRADVLKADGSLTLSDEIVFADNLSISHGDSVILLDGSADTLEGLTFRAGVDVGAYIQDVSGEVDAAGRLSRVEGRAFVSLDLTSPKIQVGDVQASGIHLTDDRAADEFAGFTLHIDDLAIQGQNVSDIRLKASIREQQQLFELTGINRASEVSLTLDGAFDDWSLAPRSPWRGNVSSFSIDLENEHRLSMEHPAAVELSATDLAVTSFCLTDDVSSRLCVGGHRRSDGRIDLRAELASVPLALIEHLVDTEAKFDQHISGSVVWSGGSDSGATGKGQFELSSGTISSLKEPTLAVQTGTGQLNFEITGGDLLSGDASVPIPGVGGLDAEFKILELSEISSSDIDGHVRLALTDIGLLTLFTDLVDSASGNLQANLDFSGTISNPMLTGFATFKDGAASYRPTGLKVDGINLRGELTENRAIELAGDFRVGDGHGEIVSSADYRDTERPGLRFKIRGKALQLVDLPDIRLSVDPDIEIAYSKHTLDINGTLLIPTARITPKNLITNITTESADVVIVAGQLPETKKVLEEDDDIQFGGSLRIDLGSDVDIVLDIARAKLSGGADFAWHGDSMPIVDGRYDLSGSVNAFGQVLDIAEGSIRYANVPASQPYLRIRAEREIFGNSQVKKAGILVTGVPSRPTIDPYTYPATTEERALTLLVTGSDFDYEQGVGAMDFGTYIAPRLFVSYGVGIFDRENIVSARYDLTKKIGIKASSGDKESGFDLNYRIEN